MNRIFAAAIALPFLALPLAAGAQPTSVLRIGDATGDGAPDLAIGGAEADGHRSLGVVSAVETPLVGEAEAEPVALRVDGGADLGLGVAASNGFGNGRPELYVSDSDAPSASAAHCAVTSTTTASPTRCFRGIASAVSPAAEKCRGASRWVPPCSAEANRLAA
jgi:hypothetical protein